MLQLGVASPPPSGYEMPNNREQVFGFVTEPAQLRESS